MIKRGEKVIYKYDGKEYVVTGIVGGGDTNAITSLQLAPLNDTAWENRFRVKPNEVERLSDG